MAMSEQLRLLFNITHFFADLGQDFTAAVAPACIILLQTTWPAPVLQPTLASVINALLCLDLKAAAGLRQKDGSPSTTIHKDVVRSLVKVLDRATLEHDEKDLEQGAAPLCTLLRKVYELADGDVRGEMQGLLLPTEHDRRKPLGQGSSISARLLRMCGSPLLPSLRENISNLLYELSDKDPERFVYNVGYGHASGFLLSHNIAVPVDGVSQEIPSSDPVNPVTGQNLAMESDDHDGLPEMTDEEKEREAERLFVLFERLKATGVVDVKNPVEDYRDKQ
ncbi:hypothetical protein AMS68_007137 [Peltaster fructicola]|uniref:Uncharacterized protein n=1 Tax=Peltaster fructicola TaxID=286661 RepID=A0A6H0Y4T4_9PEZI|nr:hypothetical protein AMS68_007137 [Peltaster fructicola]